MKLIKDPGEIGKIREAGRILAGIMEQLEGEVRPGIVLSDLDERARELIQQAGVQPSFKNYRGFPAALCVSLNETVVHGVPGERRVQQGDIVSLDLGVYRYGYHADMAVTVAVQPVDQISQRLIYTAKEALMKGVEAVRPGGHLGDIGYAISRHIKSQGFGVVRELCGHGIGQSVHEEPDVLNFGKKNDGMILQPGMVFCIEPMVTTGRGRVRLADDGLSYVTEDGSRSAHFEHTVAVSETGTEILTQL